jgi:hypothetical protein
VADLITVEEFRNYMGLGVKANETQNELMAACVSAASDWVREALNRDMDFRAYTETYDGNGLPFLWLRQEHVATSPIPTVVENGTALVVKAGYDVTADVTLDPERGVLYRQSGPTQIVGNVSRLPNRWSIGIQNIAITYSAGYSTIPADVKILTRYVAARFWKETDSKAIGISRRSAGAHSTDFMTDLPTLYREIVDQKKRAYFAR